MRYENAYDYEAPSHLLQPLAQAQSFETPRAFERTAHASMEIYTRRKCAWVNRNPTRLVLSQNFHTQRLKMQRSDVD
jgi:hypothetical protein